MLAVLIVEVYLVLLCAIVLRQNPKARVNISLVASMLAIGLWVYLTALLTGSLGTQVTIARYVFGLGVVSISALLWFIYELIASLELVRWRRNAMVSLALLTLCVVVFTILTPYVIAGVVQEKVGMIPRPTYGVFLWVYVLYLLSVSAYSTVLLWSAYISSEGRTKQQIKTVAISILSAIVAASITNLILPIVTGDTQTAIFGPIAVVLLATGLSYAIAKNGLFDIRATVVRSIAYALALATIGAVYYFAAYITSTTFFNEQNKATLSISVVSVVLAVFLSLVFQPIKSFFNKITNRIFYRGNYDIDAFITRLGSVLSSSSDLRKMLREASVEIHRTVKADTVAFVIEENEGMSSTTVGNTDVKELPLELLEKVGSYANHMSTDIVMNDDLQKMNTEVYDQTVRHRITIVALLRRGRSRIGYLVLGDHMGGGYAQRDFRALAAVIDELGIAVQNAVSVQKIKDLNKHLEQRVDEATTKLTQTNKRLRAIDASKDEFISMASHQLRTPLTSIKGYISMLLEGDLGEITPQQRKALEEAYNSSQRMVYLIGDFLNLSRLQTGRFELERTPVSLPHIIAEEIAQLRAAADARGVTLQYDPPASFPEVLVDENKIRQVMMNFIDNAIYYAKPTGGVITVSLLEHAHHVSFRVRDNGIGVPAHERPHLFMKFYRAANARKARPDGTGIGLYMAKKVIIAHGGTILFESKEGLGSEFGFRLPTKNPSI